LPSAVESFELVLLGETLLDTDSALQPAAAEAPMYTMAIEGGAEMQ
jgi:hypothetical protein